MRRLGGRLRPVTLKGAVNGRDFGCSNPAQGLEAGEGKLHAQGAWMEGSVTTVLSALSVSWCLER